MWWFFLSQFFGGSPWAWAASVGMFFGLGVGMWLLFWKERQNR